MSSIILNPSCAVGRGWCGVVIMAVGQAGSSAWHLGASRLLPPIVVVGQPSSYPVGHHGIGIRSHAGQVHCVQVQEWQVLSISHSSCVVVVVAVEWQVCLVCVCVPVKPTRNHYVVTRGCATTT